MTDPTNHDFRPELEPVLRRLRRRIRRVQAARGALVTLVTGLAALLALVALDARLSPMPLAARWALTLSGFVLVAAVAVIAWWRPLLQPLGLLRIARWLEIRHPELDERVSTAMELAATRGGGASKELMEELSRAATLDLAGINPRVEISARRARRWLVPALLLLACWAALFVMMPEWTARHVVRALSPNSRLGNAARSLVVEPGAIELIEGDSLRVAVRCEHAASAPPEIILRLRDGGTVTEALRSENGSFFYQLDKVKESFDYEVRAGREVSDRFRVTVWPRPRLADARLRLEYPAYTGLAAREQAVGDGFSAVSGTRAVLSSAVNTPVSAARFTLDGIAAGDVRRDQSAAGGALAVTWTLDQAGRQEALLTLSHRLGRDFEAARFNVETLADASPEVKWTRPTAKELKVRPDEVLDLVYQASDDFGLGSVALEVKPGQGGEAALPQPPPVLLGKAVPPAWRGEISLAMGDLLDRWPGASLFKLRMRVADGRPPELGGPHSAVSGWLTVRLDQGAEPLARRELFAAHSEVRETLEKARQAVEQARWRIDARRDDLRKGEVKGDARNELEKAREQLASAREQLEQLAAKMEETPHAPQAEAVREAAAKAGEAGEKLEEAPLQDSEQAREQTAAEAKQAAEAAEKQLRELLEKIQRAEPRLQDLARLQELAQRQREVARQAEQARAAAKPDSKVDPAWSQKQAQAAWEMRDLAAQHPQARAEALAQQAEQAKALAAEAREQAAAQQAMKDNAQAAAPADPNQADPKQADPAGLRAELAKEQAAIRDAVKDQLAEASARQDRQLANTLPEAARAAEQAANALQQPEAASAVEPTAAAATELNDVAAAAQQQAGEQQAGEQKAGEKQAGEKKAGEQQGGEQQAGEQQAGEQQGGEQQGGEQQAGEQQAGEQKGGEQQAGEQQAGEQKAGEQQAGEKNAGEQKGGEQQAGEQQAGEQQGANPQGGQPGELGQAANARAAEELGELAERQQQVADAVKALAAGDAAAARQQLAKMRAEQTADLAAEVRNLPQVGDSPGAMQQAAQATQQAAGQANQAAQQQQAAAAAAPHGEAAAQLQQAAASLDQAAADFANQANQARSQAASEAQAPMPAQPLAEAFQQASRAANTPSSAAAASQARASADALAQAARATQSSMRQGTGPAQPGQLGQSDPSDPSDQPGTTPDENSRTPQADPGVPPELAKLGVSAEDWEQIKTALRAESGGAAGAPLPEEYRDLVRRYFDHMAKGGKDD